MLKDDIAVGVECPGAASGPGARAWQGPAAGGRPQEPPAPLVCLSRRQAPFDEQYDCYYKIEDWCQPAPAARPESGVVIIERLATTGPAASRARHGSMRCRHWHAAAAPAAGTAPCAIPTKSRSAGAVRHTVVAIVVSFLSHEANASRIGRAHMLTVLTAQAR